MAIEFFDPVSQYLNSSAWLSLWSGRDAFTQNGIAQSNVGIIGTSTFGRFGGTSSLQIISARGDSTSGPYINLPNVATRFASVSGNYSTANLDWPIISFYDNTTPQVSVTINATGKFEIWRGNTLVATAGSSITWGTWHRVEVEATINVSTGFVEVHCDGVLMVNFTGNTSNSGNGYSNRVYFGNGQNGSVSAFCQDFLVYNNAGAAPNGFLGDKRIYCNFPTGNGSTQNYTQNIAAWPASTAVALGTTILDTNSNVQRVTSISGTGTTGGSHPAWNVTVGGTTTDNAGANQVVWTNLGTQTAYDLVSDIPPDGDFSYLSSATAGDIELFTFPAIPLSATGIVGVGVMPYSRKDDAATRTLRGYTSSGSATADSGTDLPQLSTYQYYEGFFPTDPNTSVAWTASGVNAAQFGTKTTA